MTTQNMNDHREVVGCPELWDLFLGLTDNTQTNPRTTKFQIANGQDAAVTYGFADGHKEEGNLIGIDVLDLTLTYLGREDGSGHNWLFEGRTLSQIYYGYVNTKTKRGWIETGQTSGDYSARLLPREQVTSGPGKMDWATSLRTNNVNHQTWIEITVDRKAEPITLNGLGLLDTSGHLWMFHGYSKDRGRVYGHYNDHTRKGWIRFEKSAPI